MKANVYSIYLLETMYTVLLAYDLTHLVIEPYYDACFPSLIVPIFGGIGTLPFILRSSTELTYPKWR